MRYLLFICVSCCIALSANAQNINDLKKKQQQAKEKIELTNKLLNETQTSKKTTVSNLSVLKKQIDERENLISALNSEISLLDNNLQTLDAQKTILEHRLAIMKKEYASLVYHAYFYKNKYNQYLFIFSSNSFSQGFRRLRYVEEYSKYRKEQSLQIQEVTNQLSEKVNQLAQTKNSKETVVKGTKIESQKLQVDKEGKQKMLTELSKKEKTLRDQLKQQQKQANELNNKIDQLIAKEIANAERKAEAKRKKAAALAASKEQKATTTQKTTSAATKATSTGTKTTSTATKVTTTATRVTTVSPSTSSIMTKEEDLIAGGFEKNIGRLPWPARGVITGHFGIHPHPVLTHVEVNNKGIYIQAQQNADASSVYEGEVTQVFAIPGSNNAIIVKHGNYRTVYANLTSTYVKVGDKVNAKQRLGKIYVDVENNNKTELYFMLYKNSTLDNPERWLSK